jgi:hypothetical protein
VGVGLIFVDQHQCPVSVGALNRVRRDECVPRSVLKITGCWIEFVNSSPMLHPLKIDQAAGVVLRREGL